MRLFSDIAYAETCQVRPGQKILDLAAGSGDLALRFADKLGDNGQLVVSDINEAMLSTGRDRLLDHGVQCNIDFIQANAETLPFTDAETLPFTDNYFDLVTIGFGLRNVTDKNKALQEMYRVLNPGHSC